MATDDFKSAQSDHAIRQKAIRALIDDTGVTRSQARAAMHQSQAQGNLVRLAQIGQANQLPKPPPNFQVQNAALNPQPLQPALGIGGGNGGAANLPSLPLSTVNWVVVDGTLYKNVQIPLKIIV